MNYLEDVPEDKAFFLADKGIRNLHGLLSELRNMGDETYSYYAGTDHNYFADWIEKVIGNEELSGTLRNALSRTAAAGRA